MVTGKADQLHTEASQAVGRGFDPRLPLQFPQPYLVSQPSPDFNSDNKDFPKEMPCLKRMNLRTKNLRPKQKLSPNAKHALPVEVLVTRKSNAVTARAAVRFAPSAAVLSATAAKKTNPISFSALPILYQTCLLALRKSPKSEAL